MNAAVVHAWISVNIDKVTSCPYSPIAYNCTDYKNNVWNQPSLAAAPSSIASSKQLCMVFLPGTKGYPGKYRNGVFSSIAALQTIHVIGLSYVSSPFSVSKANFLCGNGSDTTDSSVSNCLDTFHSTVAFGETLSSIWPLTYDQSITARLISVLSTLNKSKPLDGWNSFFDEGGIRWGNIIIAGHSQGAGHSAYVAFAKKVANVVLLSGPQDCCTFNAFTNKQWRTPTANISFMYHMYEDLRGIIEDNAHSIIPFAAVHKFSTFFGVEKDDLYYGKHYIVNNIVSNTCDCGDRAEHCSTATDLCSPQDAKELYFYSNLWQYLVSGDYVSSQKNIALESDSEPWNTLIIWIAISICVAAVGFYIFNSCKRMNKQMREGRLLPGTFVSLKNGDNSYAQLQVTENSI
jgi:hypothetical protein